MLTVGTRHERRRQVTPDDSAAKVMSGIPDVLASASMIAFIETVCAELMAAGLADGETSVGIGFDLTHEAATPIGMTMAVAVELVEIDGKKHVFAVEARDDVEVIGRGRHTRALIDRARFDQRVAKKAASAAR